MTNILFLVLITVFQIVQSENSTSNGLISSDLSLSKYYEKSAKDLVSERLSGTQFCESILLPTDHNMKKSLHATFFSARNDTYLDHADRLDSCCRSLHKCNAYKNDANHRNILHCECVYSFRICLKKLNTSLASDLAFIHSINATKCYAKDHPIVKCIKLEEYLGSASQYPRFLNLTLKNAFFTRCTKYEFDESQPRKLQLFDLPFIYPGISSIAMEIYRGDPETTTVSNMETTKEPISRETSTIPINKQSGDADMTGIADIISTSLVNLVIADQRQERQLVSGITTLPTTETTSESYSKGKKINGLSVDEVIALVVTTLGKSGCDLLNSIIDEESQRNSKKEAPSGKAVKFLRLVLVLYCKSFHIKSSGSGIVMNIEISNSSFVIYNS